MSRKEIVIGCTVAVVATGLLYYLLSQPEKKPEVKKVEERKEPEPAPVEQ